MNLAAGLQPKIVTYVDTPERRKRHGFAPALCPPPTAGHPTFSVVPAPLAGSWQEAKESLDHFLAAPEADPRVVRIFERVLPALADLAAHNAAHFRPEERVITHTDVQAHN